MSENVKKRPLRRVCPNCGQDVDRLQEVCRCGARWMGPRSAPDAPLPRLGAALTAMAMILLVFMGEGVLVLRDVALSDFIWTEALVRALLHRSLVFVPACLVALAVALRGLRAARRDPQRYGGQGLARTAAALALGAIALHATVFVTEIPRLQENRRIKRVAATRANLYHLARAIEAYKHQYGTYPRRLIDLQEMDPGFKPVVDYWGREFVYQTTSSMVAATSGPPPFQNYQLISKGPDGLLGTADDIVLQDDILVSPVDAQRDRAADVLSPSAERKHPRAR
jgi:hypothetical protein